MENFEEVEKAKKTEIKTLLNTFAPRKKEGPLRGNSRARTEERWFFWFAEVICTSLHGRCVLYMYCL